jgi:hypothetical protein
VKGLFQTSNIHISNFKFIEMTSNYGFPSKIYKTNNKKYDKNHSEFQDLWWKDYSKFLIFVLLKFIFPNFNNPHYKYVYFSYFVLFYSHNSVKAIPILLEFFFICVSNFLAILTYYWPKLVEFDQNCWYLVVKNQQNSVKIRQKLVINQAISVGNMF